MSYFIIIISIIYLFVKVTACSLYNIARWWPVLTLSVAKVIADSVVSSWLDYANALLYSTSAISNIDKLQVTVLTNSLATLGVTSAAPLVASLSTTDLQTGSYHIPRRETLAPQRLSVLLYRLLFTVGLTAATVHWLAKVYLQKLQSVQNMAARMVSGVRRSEHTT